MGEAQEQEGQTVETTETTETRTVETTMETAQGTEQGAERGQRGDGDDLEKVRELVLRAHPDVVPDLIRGNSVDELLASVEPATSAFQRIAEQVRGQSEGATKTTVTAEPGATVTAQGETTVVVQPPAVPAGGASNVIDPASIPPTEKIARALAAERG